MGSDWCTTLRSYLSNTLLFFSCIIVLIGVCNDYNVLELGGPLFELPLLFCAGVVLFLNEGYQVGILGVRYFSEPLMAGYPHAKKVRSLIFSKDYDRLPRLFLGQSFLVVVTTFLISGLTTFTEWPESGTYLNGLFPEWFMSVFVRSGLPGVLMCVNLFQLLPSLYAQRFPRELLEYVPAVYGTIVTSLFIESMGLLHCTFLFVDVLEWMLPNSDDSIEVQGREQGGRLVGSGPFGSFPSQFSTFCTTIASVGTNQCMADPTLGRSSSSGTVSCMHSSTGSHSEWSGQSGRDSILHMGNSAAVEQGVAARGGQLLMTEPRDVPELSDSDNGPVDVVFLEEEDGVVQAPLKNTRFHVKMWCSAVITLACFVYIMYSLFDWRSNLGLHPILLVLLVILAFAVVFLAEGIKIAICGTAAFSTADMEARGYSTELHMILTDSGGTLSNGIGKFLLGRQLVVVPLNFLLANIFAFKGYDSVMGPVMYDLFVGFSLPVIIFTMQLMQLAPQVFAGRHTDTFLRVRGASFVVKLSIFIERLGLTSPAHSIVEIVARQTGCCFPNAPKEQPADNVPFGLNSSERATQREDEEETPYEGDDVINL